MRIGSQSAIHYSRNIITEYHWLPYRKCTVNLSHQIIYSEMSHKMMYI